MAKKLTINEIKEFVRKNSDCVLLSDEYINRRSQLIFRCKCGEVFKTSYDNFKWSNKRQCDFCSGKKVKSKICPICKKEFKPIKRKQVCCSKSCAQRLKNPTIYVKCEICGKKVPKTKFELKRNKHNYCSPKCRNTGVKKFQSGKNNPNYKGKSYIGKCDNCGEEMIITNYDKRFEKRYRYCSPTCKAEHQKKILLGEKNPNYGNRGEKNPLWNPDRTDDERQGIRNIYGYKDFVKKVFERDNYICKCCGNKIHGDGIAHHLEGYNWCKAKRTDISNGITLCKKCHKEFHDKYGNGNNTKEQFFEYLAEKNITTL